MSEDIDFYGPAWPRPETSGDPVVDRVRDKLKLRSMVGQRKYGARMDRTDLDLVEWIRHLQEELLDSAIYAERIMDDLEKDSL